MPNLHVFHVVSERRDALSSGTHSRGVLQCMCMHEGNASAAEWTPVRIAAKSAGVSVRTLYACIERKQIDARKVNGALHVKSHDVAQLATARTGTATRGVGESPALAAARERVAAKHLEVQELSSEVAAERHRKELAEVEAEREEKRQLIALQVEREKFALERERDEHRRKEAEREERLRLAAHERTVEQMRARESSRQRQAEESATRRRRKWERTWLLWATEWVRRETQRRPDPENLLPLVQQSLVALDPDDQEERVARVLRDELRARFAATLEQRERDDVAAARRTLARIAARSAARSSSDYDRLLSIAEKAAECVDPRTEVGQLVVVVAVAQAQRAIVAHEAAVVACRENELELARRAQQAEWDRQQRQRDWDAARAEVPSLVRRELPLLPTAGEFDEGVRVLLGELERRAPGEDPRRFRGAACWLLTDVRRRVEERQRGERHT